MRSDNRLVNDFISASLFVRHLFVARWVTVDAAGQESKSEGHFFCLFFLDPSPFLSRYFRMLVQQSLPFCNSCSSWRRIKLLLMSYGFKVVGQRRKEFLSLLLLPSLFCRWPTWTYIGSKCSVTASLRVSVTQGCFTTTSPPGWCLQLFGQCMWACPVISAASGCQWCVM